MRNQMSCACDKFYLETKFKKLIQQHLKGNHVIGWRETIKMPSHMQKASHYTRMKTLTTVTIQTDVQKS